MKSIQQTFEGTILREFDFFKLASMIVAKKMRLKGINLTEQQVEKIKDKLRSAEGDTARINLDDCLDLSEDWPDLSLEIDDADIDETLDELMEIVAGKVPEIADDISGLLLDSLKSDSPSMLRLRKRERRAFEGRLSKIWRKPLGLLGLILVIALEVGSDLNREFRDEASRDGDYVFEVLTRLHARACQITSEILCLLRAGHADGAHARWRTLHEIVVVACFVKAEGNAIAEKYLLHDSIESYKAAIQYQQYHAELGYEALPSEEVETLKRMRDSLVARFGAAFKNDYGWAAPIGNNKNPTIADIEGTVDLRHFRPFYKLASHNVHANAKGIYFRLGVLPERKEMLLAGPSNAGLADPGHGTAISLVQITTVLLTYKANLDRLVVCRVMSKLEQMAGDRFLSVHQDLQQRSLGNKMKAGH